MEFYDAFFAKILKLVFLGSLFLVLSYHRIFKLF